LKRVVNWRSLQDLFQQHRQELSTQDFAQLLKSLQNAVKPQFMNVAETRQLHAFLDELSAYAQDAAQSLKAQEWATMIVMLGQLQYHGVDPNLMHTAMLTLHQQVDSMTALELARTISNAVNLGSAPAADLQPLVKAFGNHLGADLRGPHFSADTIEPVISALKKMNLNPGSTWLHKFDQALQQNLKSIPTQSIISILAAFVYFKFVPQEQLVVQVVKRIGSNFFDLRPSNIPVILEALVLFQHQPSEMFMRQIVSRSLVSSTYFTPQEVVTLLECLTQLGQKLDSDWVDVFVLQVGASRHTVQRCRCSCGWCCHSLTAVLMGASLQEPVAARSLSALGSVHDCRIVPSEVLQH
jgi:hypothetical protein